MCMRYALATLLLLGACTTAPDPLAFAVEQTTLPELAPYSTSTTLDGRVGVMPIAPEVTAICRDGWFSYSRQRSGTCSGHGGVGEWVNRPAA